MVKKYFPHFLLALFLFTSVYQGIALYGAYMLGKPIALTAMVFMLQVYCLVNTWISYF